MSSSLSVMGDVFLSFFGRLGGRFGHPWRSSGIILGVLAGLGQLFGHLGGLGSQHLAFSNGFSMCWHPFLGKEKNFFSSAISRVPSKGTNNDVKLMHLVG